MDHSHATDEFREILLESQGKLDSAEDRVGKQGPGRRQRGCLLAGGPDLALHLGVPG